MSAALDISNLTVKFRNGDRELVVVDRCSVRVEEGEITGLVGESGSGKSLTALCAMGLQPSAAIVSADRCRVAGHDVLELSEQALEKFRGNGIALIPQEPMSALNPTMRIGEQLEIVVRAHRPASRKKAQAIAVEYLDRMLIPEPKRTMRAYAYELSGGMRQRVLLAMALSCQPKVLIADEPTTALDVTVQKEVLQLIRESAAASSTAVLFITHDLAVLWELCERVYVLEKGGIVESGKTVEVIGNPQHVYTRRLLAALPGQHPPRTPLPVDQS